MSSAQRLRLLNEYERSGLTRRAYCEQIGIPVSTFDYYRRRQIEAGNRELVPVRIAEPVKHSRFTVVLANGRQVKSGWEFGAEDLVRLIRVLERA